MGLGLSPSWIQCELYSWAAAATITITIVLTCWNLNISPGAAWFPRETSKQENRGKVGTRESAFVGRVTPWHTDQFTIHLEWNLLVSSILFLPFRTHLIFTSAVLMPAISISISGPVQSWLLRRNKWIERERERGWLKSEGHLVPLNTAIGNTYESWDALSVSWLSLH